MKRLSGVSVILLRWNRSSTHLLLCTGLAAWKRMPTIIYSNRVSNQCGKILLMQMVDVGSLLCVIVANLLPAMPHMKP